MNLNGDEKRIQQLFREMSRDELRRAPQFAELLAAANSRIARSRNHAGSFRFAMAAVVCAVLLIAIALTMSAFRSQRGESPDQQASVPAEDSEAPRTADPFKPNTGTSNPAPRRVVPKRARHRRASDKTAIAMKSLFAWRSPTSSLLKIQEDELLKSLPSLGESLRTIKTYTPDQFN